MYINLLKHLDFWSSSMHRSWKLLFIMMLWLGIGYIWITFVLRASLENCFSLNIFFLPVHVRGKCFIFLWLWMYGSGFISIGVFYFSWLLKSKTWLNSVENYSLTYLKPLQNVLCKYQWINCNANTVKCARILYVAL